MKFRRGGKLAGRDHLWLNGEKIEYVYKFTYLGITLSTSGHSFANHIDDRLHKTILAFSAIRSPQMLSVETAIRLFNLKLAPTTAYGIPIIWNFLNVKDMMKLESAETSILKRCLSLHPASLNAKSTDLPSMRHENFHRRHSRLLWPGRNRGSHRVLDRNTV